jgi:hemerythrin-like domain-containing protein
MHQEFFNTLHKDHMEVDNLMSKTEMLTGSSRQVYLGQLKEELVPHIRGEEKAFYPRLLEHDESKTETQKAIREHQEAEGTFQRLLNLSPATEEWMTVFNQFRDQIHHHVEEEESRIFDLARKVLSEDQMKTVLNEFNAEKERAKKGVAVR